MGDDRLVWVMFITQMVLRRLIAPIIAGGVLVGGGAAVGGLGVLPSFPQGPQLPPGFTMPGDLTADHSGGGPTFMEPPSSGYDPGSLDAADSYAESNADDIPPGAIRGISNAEAGITTFWDRAATLPPADKDTRPITPYRVFGTTPPDGTQPEDPNTSDPDAGNTEPIQEDQDTTSTSVPPPDSPTLPDPVPPLTDEILLP